MLAVFAVMALGSFMGIANDHQGIGDCIASTINGGACPENASLLELVSFHTGAFSAFSLALAASFFAFALIASAFLFASEIFPLISFFTTRAIAVVPHEFVSSQAHLSALARLEHSPTR